MNEEWTGKCLRQVEHICGHLWHRYSITVNQLMVATIKLSKWWLQLNQEQPEGTKIKFLRCSVQITGNTSYVFRAERKQVYLQWRTLHSLHVKVNLYREPISDSSSDYCWPVTRQKMTILSIILSFSNGKLNFNQLELFLAFFYTLTSVPNLRIELMNIMNIPWVSRRLLREHWPVSRKVTVMFLSRAAALTSASLSASLASASENTRTVDLFLDNSIANNMKYKKKYHIMRIVPNSN